MNRAVVPGAEFKKAPKPKATVADGWADYMSTRPQGFFITLNTDSFFYKGFGDPTISRKAIAFEETLVNIGKCLREYCLGRAYRRTEISKDTIKIMGAIEVGDSGLFHAHLVVGHDGSVRRSDTDLKAFLKKKIAKFPVENSVITDVDVKPMHNVFGCSGYIQKQSKKFLFSHSQGNIFPA